MNSIVSNGIEFLHESYDNISNNDCTVEKNILRTYSLIYIISNIHSKFNKFDNTELDKLITNNDSFVEFLLNDKPELNILQKKFMDYIVKHINTLCIKKRIECYKNFLSIPVCEKYLLKNKKFYSFSTFYFVGLNRWI